MFVLRPNQKYCVDKSVEYFNEKKVKPKLIVAPVAAGKSLLIAATVMALNAPCLILQPSKELLEQNYSKLESFGIKACIYSASKQRKEVGNIIYATLGSIKNKGKFLKEYGIKHILIDEAHLYPANLESVFRKFMLELNVTSCLGFTATPIRLVSRGNVTDRYSELNMLHKGIPRFFSDILHVIPISEMIENGYWKKLEYQEYDLTDKVLQLNQRGSEYTDESITLWSSKKIVSTEVKKHVDLQLAKGKKAIIVFLQTLKECKEISMFTPDSVVIHGGMTKEDRNKAIKDFKSGKIKVAFSVNVLTTGFDYPELDCLILARPTMSLALYYQMIGRITRIHPLGAIGTIIDLVGNVKRFGKIEELNVDYIDGYGWAMFSKNKLLTGVPLDGRFGDITKQKLIKKYSKDKPIDVRFSFGKYKNVNLKNIPKYYLTWTIKNVNFTINKEREVLKTEILKLI